MKNIELPKANEIDKLVDPWDAKEFDRIANAIIRKVRKRESVLHWPFQVSEPVRIELYRRGHISEASAQDRDGWLTTFDWSKKDLDNILNGKY